jgi:hypothetical protein
MTDDSLRDDISFLRRMAESGRKGPILGGIFLMMAGVVYGGACFVSYLGRHGMTPIPVRDWSELTLWLTASAVFVVLWAVLFIRTMRGGKAVSSASNATFGTIWSACGVGMIVAFLTTLLVARKLAAPIVLNAYVPVIFAFYGTAWIASAALAQRRWMFVAAAASFLFAGVLALLAENDLQSLAMGGGLLLLLAMPGLKLLKDEARA